jgi:UDP-2-acetamido-2,6-beta-L-arabino-hexul-4-ose reductase
MSVLITGSSGFIGKNLVVRLKELNIEVKTYTRENSINDLKDLIRDTNCIVHLAGVNRPENDKDFDEINVGLTASICDIVQSLGKNIPIIFASSTQIDQNNIYGKSKLSAEICMKALEDKTECSVYVYRLPGVFGKWCKPNYNSVVATFCNNISQGLPIQIHNREFEITLIYIDDVVEEFIKVIQGLKKTKNESSVQPEYKIKLGDLVDKLNFLKESRSSLLTEKVGTGFVRKLYSTYLSYLSPCQFSYDIPSYDDDRGKFVEILKTRDSGQFSFFTANPGVTRGNHYHHTKIEKFLVIKGKARFCFEHIISGEMYEITTNSKSLKIVETTPGWSHNITNIGKEEMIVLLWANEIFNPEKPDTIAYNLRK